MDNSGLLANQVSDESISPVSSKKGKLPGLLKAEEILKIVVSNHLK